MRPVRSLAASAAGVVAVGLMTVVAPSATAVEGIPAACPDGTAKATTIGSDDFDPNTGSALPWTQEPADSWTATDAEDWYLYGSTPAEAGGTKSVSAQGPLPADSTTVAVITHAYDFGDDAAEVHDEGIIEVGVDGTWTELDRFSSTASKATNEYDLSQWTGQNVDFRFRIVGDGTPPETADHGWSLYDVAFVRCDPAEEVEVPGAPTSVSAVARYHNATVSWQPPTSGGPVDGYTVTVSPGGASYDVDAQTTSQAISGLSGGTTYTFTVVARNESGTGPSASKTLAGTTIEMSAPTVITYGSTVKISGTATRVDINRGLYQYTLSLQGRGKGTKAWRTRAYAKTGAGGKYSFVHRPTVNMEYRVLFYGNSRYVGSTSAVDDVLVRPKVTANVSDSTPRVNQTIRYSGSVSPKHPYQKAYLQVRFDGVWYFDERFIMTLSPESNYGTYLYFTSPGTYYFRTVTQGHDDHAQGFSPTRKIVVHD